MSEIKTGIYRHYKGNLYEVLDLATHSETEEVYIVYRALYGEHKLWIRPKKMFFESVILNGNEVPRFEYLENSRKND